MRCLLGSNLSSYVRHSIQDHAGCSVLQTRLADLRDGQELVGTVFRQMLYHGAQIDIGAEYDGCAQALAARTCDDGNCILAPVLTWRVPTARTSQICFARQTH